MPGSPRSTPVVAPDLASRKVTVLVTHWPLGWSSWRRWPSAVCRLVDGLASV